MAADYDYDACVLDTCRYFGPTEWGYRIECLNPEHRDRAVCPGERVLFSRPRQQAGRFEQAPEG